jgi:predicted 2-oxoglutarate/Fe(II)-dependent dioxygenase YbiX
VEKVDTGSSLIHRYDGALNPDICGRLCDYIRTHTTREEDDTDLGKLPWQDSDTHSYGHWQDHELRRLIGAYRFMVTQLICLNFRKIVFPHFTDLVLWRPGRKMAEHKDDGYPEDGDQFTCRHFSAVTYCNDDYAGGETFIRNERGEHYVGKPLTGTLIFYPSDERCTHGVNEVIGNDRITLSNWFTRDVAHFRG